MGGHACGAGQPVHKPALWEDGQGAEEYGEGYEGYTDAGLEHHTDGTAEEVQLEW